MRTAVLAAIFLAPLSAKAQGVFSFEKPEAEAAAPKTRLEQVLEIVRTKYTDELTAEEVEEQAIAELINNLDPYSAYMKPDRYRQFNEGLNDWEINPLGLRLWNPTSGIGVWSIQPGSSAARLGILPGDVIREVSGQSTAQLDAFAVDSLIRLAGGRMRLITYRQSDGKLHGFNITPADLRDHHKPFGWMVDDKTGYLLLENFNAYAAADVLEELRRLKASGMEQLVFDLRANYGGFVNEAVGIASLFLEPNTEVVRAIKRGGESEVYHTRAESEFRSIPLIVLVDSNTASASEILAGAFQDLDRALIVGQQTRGKGTVMNQFSLSDGSSLLLSTGKLILPSGRTVQMRYHGWKLLPQPIISTTGYNLDHSADAPVRNPDYKPVLTAAGRRVYGGQGVVPDYILPRATPSALSDLMGSKRYFSVIWDYVQSEAKDLAADYTAENFAAKFVLPSRLIDSLMTDYKASSGGVIPYASQAVAETVRQEDREWAAARMRGSIGIMFFGQPQYTRCLNQNDLGLKQAVSLFSVAKQVAGLR